MAEEALDPADAAASWDESSTLDGIRSPSRKLSQKVNSVVFEGVDTPSHSGVVDTNKKINQM